VLVGDKENYIRCNVGNEFPIGYRQLPKSAWKIWAIILLAISSV